MKLVKRLLHGPSIQGSIGTNKVPPSRVKCPLDAPLQFQVPPLKKFCEPEVLILEKMHKSLALTQKLVKISRFERQSIFSLKSQVTNPLIYYHGNIQKYINSYTTKSSVSIAFYITRLLKKVKLQNLWCFWLQRSDFLLKNPIL